MAVLSLVVGLVALLAIYLSVRSGGVDDLKAVLFLSTLAFCSTWGGANALWG